MRGRTRALGAGIGLVLLAMCGVAGAEESATPAAPLSEEDRADIARVETYLESIKTLRTRFMQIAPDGGIAQGMMYMSRPDRMRIEYDGPVPFLIVTTGVWLILYDGELQQTTYLPIGSSPAAILLQDRVDLSGDVTVTRVERAAGALRLHIVEEDRLGRGSIYLTFAEQPLKLREWTVIDAQGQATQVALLNPEFGIELDPVLFMYTAPGPDQFDRFDQ